MTQPTPREVPVREAEWPHRRTPDVGEDGNPFCLHCSTRDRTEPWPCPSQQYLDGLVAAVREARHHMRHADFCGAGWTDVETSPHCICGATQGIVRVDAFLEGARATDDEGQR